MTVLKIAHGAEKFIGLQRLETQLLGSKIHYTGIGAVLYQIYEKVPFAKNIYGYYSTNIEPRLRREVIFKDYSAVMKREFGTIEPYLPENLHTVMGIGPGVAGLEAFTSLHCAAENKPEPEIVLLDKTGIDPIHFGFQETAAAYNSLALSKSTLEQNGHSSAGITVVEADNAPELLDTHRGKIDMVTSLIAWGFHFPVNTYLELVYELLSPGGRLIIDVRKGTDGHTLLADKFGNSEVILDDDKFERVLVQKAA